MKEFGFHGDDTLEISVEGKKLRFSFCVYRQGFPLDDLLRGAEEKRKQMKGSGVVCIAGASDMEKIVPIALNSGYRIYMLDLDGHFLYGRGIFPVIRIRDFRRLKEVLEEIL